MFKTKIKILYIIPSFASGGAEKFLLDLITNLNQEIFEIKVLTFNGGGFFEKEFLKRKINFVVLNKKLKIDPFNFYLIYKNIRKFSPDIVHTQLGGDIYGKLAAKLAGVKKIISTEQNVLNNDSIFVSFLKKITANFSNKIIAISTPVKKDIVNKYKISEDKVILIPNGVNPLNFSSQNKKEDQKEKIFGSIGRLDEQKNFSLLIEALTSFKDKNFSCLIAGEGRLKNELQQKINDLGLSQKIKLIGNIEDVSGFLNSLDFFILPSKWEGLGIVLLEAGSSNLPVLASATGGILDIIKDKQTGILFKNNDLNDLILKLDYFLDEKNKENLAIIAKNLNEFVKKEFDIKVVSLKYQDVYLGLLKE